MKTLIIGLGETGKALFNLLKASDPEVVGRDRTEPPEAKGRRFDVLHVCITEGITFSRDVADYADKYHAKAAVIHSSVHPGATEKTQRLTNAEVYYAPINGNIRDGMEWGLKAYTMRLASVRPNPETLPAIVKQLNAAGIRVKTVEDPKSLEYAKNFDLAYYGSCIAVWQQIERIAEAEGLNYEAIKDFVFSIPAEAAAAGKTVERARYYGGYIGGHCVVPALERLTSLHDAPIFEAALKSNVQRFRELQEKSA